MKNNFLVKFLKIKNRNANYNYLAIEKLFLNYKKIRHKNYEKGTF